MLANKAEYKITPVSELKTKSPPAFKRINEGFFNLNYYFHKHHYLNCIIYRPTYFQSQDTDLELVSNSSERADIEWQENWSFIGKSNKVCSDADFDHRTKLSNKNLSF